MSDEERKKEEQDVEAHTKIRPTSASPQTSEDPDREEPDVEAHSHVRPLGPRPT